MPIPWRRGLQQNSGSKGRRRLSLFRSTCNERWQARAMGEEPQRTAGASLSISSLCCVQGISTTHDPHQGLFNRTRVLDQSYQLVSQEPAVYSLVQSTRPCAPHPPFIPIHHHQADFTDSSGLATNVEPCSAASAGPPSPETNHHTPHRRHRQDLSPLHASCCTN